MPAKRISKLSEILRSRTVSGSFPRGSRCGPAGYDRARWCADYARRAYRSTNLRKIVGGCSMLRANAADFNDSAVSGAK
jgi:hypothetical protein